METRGNVRDRETLVMNDEAQERLNDYIQERIKTLCVFKAKRVFALPGVINSG